MASMPTLLPAVGGLFFPVLILIYLIAGNSKAISKAFEKSPNPRADCFLKVWGNTASKLGLLFALVSGVVLFMNGSMSASESLMTMALVFIWAGFLGAMVGFFPALAAAIGAKYSEAASKKAMIGTMIAEMLLVAALTFSNS